MGCRQSASYERKSPENEKIEKLEESFGLKQNECSVYEGILSRLLNSSQPADEMLSTFQKFSKIAFREDLRQVILSAFAKDEKLDLKSFRCFCILLSKSSEIDKGEALWYTFDTNLQEFLPSALIRSLITCLVKCAVFIALDVAISSQYFDVEKLTEWQTKLKERIESIETKLNKHFAQGKETVSKEEFMLRLQDRPEGLITSMAALRTQIEHTQVIPKKFAAPFRNMRVTKLTE